MFPFAQNAIPDLKRGFRKSLLTFLDPQKNGDTRTQNGDSVRGVVSKRPITGRISKRGFSRFDMKGPKVNVCAGCVRKDGRFPFFMDLEIEIAGFLLLGFYSC